MVDARYASSWECVVVLHHGALAALAAKRYQTALLITFLHNRAIFYFEIPPDNLGKSDNPDDLK